MQGEPVYPKRIKWNGDYAVFANWYFRNVQPVDILSHLADYLLRNGLVVDFHKRKIRNKGYLSSMLRAPTAPKNMFKHVSRCICGVNFSIWMLGRHVMDVSEYQAFRKQLINGECLRGDESSSMGVYKPLWSKDEEKILLKDYQDHTDLELEQFLPGRSAHAIYSKRLRMGLYKVDAMEAK